MPAAPGKTAAPPSPLSQADRVLEKRLRDVGIALSRNPQLVEHETLVWLVGAVLSQRDRFATIMRGAAAELEEMGCDKHDLIAVLKAYGNIRELK